MDYMDVDQILEVPDTPDRIPAQNINTRNCLKRGNHSSVTNHSLAKGLSDERVINRPTENGTQRLLFRTSKNPANTDKSDLHVSSSVSTLRNSSSPKNNALPLRRTEKGKGICISNSNSERAEEFRKLSIPANALSSLRGPSNSTSTLTNVDKVKEIVDEKCKANLGSDRGKGIGLVHDSLPKVGKIGQKRLVRNGCISPLNIAKVKQSTEKSTEKPKNGTVASEGRLDGIVIRDLVTEPSDSHRVRGKTVISHPLSSKVPDGVSSRSLKPSNEKSTYGTGNSSVGEEVGGWRSTRNCKNTNPPSSVPPFMQAVQPASAHFKRQKQGHTLSTNGECSTSNFDDSELVCLGSSGELSSFRSSGARNGNGPGRLDPVIKIDEFSPQARNNNRDSETRARQLEADEILARELQEELYNEIPVFGAPVSEIGADLAYSLQQQESTHQAVPSRNRAARPRNSLISNLRRQNPTIRRGAPVRSPTSARTARLRTRFPGQPRTLSSSSSSSRGGGGISLFSPNMDLDMDGMKSYPVPCLVLDKDWSRGGLYIYPAEASYPGLKQLILDRRMQVLETLEAFSDMGIPAGHLQFQRDFNENDYEMLLALDENNHQHAGSSISRINGLPESKVQSENHQEACAICLDTPEIGDTIRHLPCLHKFHKDCIDPWLRRKTLCPVCKSSIT